MISGQEMQRIIKVQMAKRDINSKAELCRAVGISPQKFSAYVTGKARVPITVLPRISSYLGMTQEERGAFLM